MNNGISYKTVLANKTLGEFCETEECAEVNLEEE